MSTTALTEAQTGALRPIVYDIDEVALASARERYAALSATTTEGYEEVRIARGEMRSMRTAIEARRKDLKAESLEYGRNVDAVAKELTKIVESIEEPLKAKMDAADKERERKRREKVEAELVAREAELKAEREAEEGRLKAAREAEEQRLRAETERMAKDLAAFEARQAEADKKRAEEQAAIDAQRAELDAKAAALREQEAKQRVEDEVRAAAERARIAAEEAGRAAELEAARLEALRPEIERVRAWGASLRTVLAAAPAVESRDGSLAVSWAKTQIAAVAVALEKFTPRKGA